MNDTRGGFEWVSPSGPGPVPRRVSSFLLVRRAEWAVRRAARERRRRLERDIGCYRTPAERRELLAILARHPEPAAREVRAVLDRQIVGETLRSRQRWTP